jgi:putative ABC transport system permease protein
MALATDGLLALRSLRRTPGLVFVAALSLAVGIAVNVTMFVALDPMVLRPLDGDAGDRMVLVLSANRKSPVARATSYPDLRDWQREARTVALAGYQSATFNWTDGAPPERLGAARVSGGFLEVNGLHPLLGRSLRLEDETAGAAVVMISARLWHDRFASAPDVVGRTMRLDGAPYTIIGVLPPHRFPFADYDVLAPLESGPAAADRAARRLFVVGRLADRATPASAQHELQGIMGRLAESYPATNRDYEVRALPVLGEVVQPQTRRIALVLFAAVGLVLLIACANVANLLLTRAAGQAREIAIRSALGAGRGRITRQLLLESVFLAATGALLGLVLALGGTAWLRELFSGPGARAGVADQLHLSWRAFGFGLGVTAVAVLLFGLFPSIRAAAPNLLQVLRDGDRTATGGRGHARLRTALVTSELAIALVLLVPTNLLLQAGLRMRRLDLGFVPRQATSFRTALSGPEFRDSTRRAEFVSRVEASLRAVPGVEAVGAGASLPLWGGFDRAFAVVGQDQAEPEGVGLVFMISPGYLAATGMRLLRGRNIAESDRLGAPRVALVNEVLARRIGSDPVGRRLRKGGVEYEVIGVVANLKVSGQLTQPTPESVFLPAAQTPLFAPTFVVRSARSAESLTPAFRAAVEAVVPGQPIFEVRSLAESAKLAWYDLGIMTQLLAALGLAAVILAVIGVYGVMAHAVTQRTAEIGIRRMLGAGTAHVIRLLAEQGVLMVGVGAVVGLPVAFGIARVIASVLPEVSGFDLGVFVAVPGVLLLTAAAATYIPARRAAKVEALVALRSR